jgi:hypothetical protein
MRPDGREKPQWEAEGMGFEPTRSLHP